MEYQKILNLLNDQTTQPSNFRTKNWVEINGDRCGSYHKNNRKFTTAMLNASLCDYSGAYVIVEGRIIAIGQRTDDAAIASDRNHKEIVFKNYTI